MRLAVCVLVAAMLASCSSHREMPPAELPEQYFSVGPYQALDDAALANWWVGFGDNDLSRLINTGLSRNQDVRLAIARLDTARAQLRNARADIYPTLSAPTEASRQWIDADAGDSELGKELGLGDRIRVQNWEVALQASWEVDLFGATRARIRGAEEEARAAQAEIVAMRLAVASTIAQGYIQLRGHQAQRDELNQAIALAEKFANIAQRRFDTGEVTLLDVQASLAEKESLIAQLAETDANLREAGLALNTLLDMPPGSVEQSLGQRPVPLYNGAVAIGQPADLLRRRPDVIADIARLDASSQQAIAARRDLFPSLALQAALGRSGFAIGGQSSVSDFGRIGLTFDLPFLDFMRRDAAINIADSQQQVAYLTLRQTLAKALEEVERAAVRQDGSERRAGALQRSLAHRERAHQLADRSYQLGEANLNEVLDAQRQVIDARQQANRVRSDRAIAQIELFVALGGGWSGAALEEVASAK